MRAFVAYFAELAKLGKGTGVRREAK
jgi:hypothetical protein